MLQFNKPIPVVVEKSKEGYAIYVTDSGTYENDIWCVVHCDGGIVRHYRSDQIRICQNKTFDIIKQEEEKKEEDEPFVPFKPYKNTSDQKGLTGDTTQ
jgi:hypothetical protein